MIGPGSAADPDRLRKAMSELRAIEREVLFLSAADGLTNRSIGELLGISAATVERILADAVRKLDRALD